MSDEKTMERFYKAWNFLNEHPAFERTYLYDGSLTKFKGKVHKDVRFDQALRVDVVKVQPRNNRVNIEDDKKNTKVDVWLECGRWMTEKELYGKARDTKNPRDGAYCHDGDLDCGADAFEEAIIKLARLVKKHYGNKKSKHL